jgi:hypothetical protein
MECKHGGSSLGPCDPVTSAASTPPRQARLAAQIGWRDQISQLSLQVKLCLMLHRQPAACAVRFCAQVQQQTVACCAHYQDNQHHSMYVSVTVHSFLRG